MAYLVVAILFLLVWIAIAFYKVIDLIRLRAEQHMDITENVLNELRQHRVQAWKSNEEYHRKQSEALSADLREIRSRSQHGQD